MEALAQQPDAHIVWMSEIGRMEGGGVLTVLTALTIEDAAYPVHRMHGVRVDLSKAEANDRIFLDEQAITRTVKALNEIQAGVARSESNPRRHIQGNPHSCFGVAAFWPLYNWPWNKYHELNISACGTAEGMGLSLSGRNKPGSYFVPDETPAKLAALLETALDQLRSH
ncbi:MAG TPA: hypothetical protein VG675_07385 [Bryobacteraceae bacterium]|nr:hypothetical protein [Bryobacteraceae bacterium]